jgi:hypothetical protein
MKRTTHLLSCIGLTIATCAGMFAQAQRQPPTPDQAINGLFADLIRRVLDMARDFEQEGEHYGLLVAYYREMGLVPPESRPK